MDSNNAIITWTQTGANESATNSGTLSLQPASVTLYPSAFIIGTNNATTGNAQLATNTVPFVNGDIVTGAPTSEFQSVGVQVYQGQTTSVNSASYSRGISFIDSGPSPVLHAYEALNNSSVPSSVMFYTAGPYSTNLYFLDRPANNGSIIYVQGVEPITSNPKMYNIFTDNNARGSSLRFDPNSQTFSFYGPYLVNLGVWGLSSAVALAGEGNNPSITFTSGSGYLSAGSTNTAGAFTSTSTGPAAFTLQWWALAYPHRANCTFTDETTAGDVVRTTAATTTTLTASGTVVNGDLISYICVGY